MTQYIKGQRIVVREDVLSSHYFRTAPEHAQYLIERCAGRECVALGMESLSRLVRVVTNGYGSSILGSVTIPVAYVKGL